MNFSIVGIKYRHFGEIDTKEKKIHERFHLKFLWIEPFHNNFIGILGVDSFYPNGLIGEKKIIIF